MNLYRRTASLLPRVTLEAGRRTLSQLGPLSFFLLISLLLLSARKAPAAAASEPAGEYLSPTVLLATADQKDLFIACATGARVLHFDLAQNSVKRTWAVPAEPLGLALSSDGTKLIVTCAAPESVIVVIDTASGEIQRRFPAGHTAMAPVLSADGATLFVAHRFNNEVAWFDLATGQVTHRITVPREPVAATLTADGKFLLVANHLHAGPADASVVASSVSVIDVAAKSVAKEIRLPNGSGLLRDVRVSPDGRYACVTHLLSRFHLPTTQIERGWINNNALTLIDTARLEPITTVLLDNIDSGAANPWAIAWSADTKKIVVTHAGTHEISAIDLPALLAKLDKLPDKLDPKARVDYTVASRTKADVPNDLSFLVGVRRRIKLPENDRGPRAALFAGTRVYVANYFSDSLTAVDLSGEYPQLASLSLGPKTPLSPVRAGEFYFNDATICFQGWQSCGSCHSSDGRVDGLNWDNLNDGIGNPKNVRSLLLAHATPPSMALGVRSNAFVAVRAGIKNSLFTVQPEEVSNAIDVYLQALKPMPSPLLVKGKLSPAAQRGKDLFFSEKLNCAECHKPPYFTNLQSYDVGSLSRFDKPGEKFDTPSLIEAWRTPPYLHDGSAVTMRDVFTTRNSAGQHGNFHGFTSAQIDDLVAYVLSL